jgi:hypothetical protein
MNAKKDIAIVSPDKIPGSPSLDQIFGVGTQNIGRNEFNVSSVQADAGMKRNLQQQDNQVQGRRRTHG